MLPTHIANCCGPLARHLAWMVGAGVVLISTIWCVYGKLVAERTLTSLALPGGFLTILLGYCVFLAVRFGRSKWLSLNLLLAFAIYFFAGGGFLSGWMLHVLERDFYDLRPLESAENFDVLLVLGGGTSVMGDGRIQSNEAGDRVVLAARMYNSGKAKRIVVFGGNSVRKNSSEPTAAATLVAQLGVDRAAIQQVVGDNTYAELRQAKELLGASPAGRVGLVTSAWHMRRALRLAHGCGLKVEPVPADFRTTGLRTEPYEWLPTGGGFSDCVMASKEFVAAWVGR